jgi:two-component system LytT family response regulator
MNSESSRIRTLVVDHDLCALARVLSLLKQEADIELVGECSTGPHALSLVDDLKPNLVFLEAGMPGLDGLEFARSLAHGGSAVVFVTTHHDYAVRAFDSRAVDYVLKPFSDERFMSAVSRARLHLSAGPRNKTSATHRGTSKRAGSGRRHFVVKSNGRVHLLRGRDIDWCEAVGNYVRLHVGSQTHLSRCTLTQLAQQLDSEQFVRVHRSIIVNIDRIQELQPWANGEYVILLRDQTQLRLSRGYRRSFEAVLGDSL